MTYLPPLPVAIPLLVAALCSAIGTFLPRRLIDLIAILTAAAVLLICLRLTGQAAHSPITYWFGGWSPSWVGGRAAIGVSFQIDAIGAGMASLVSLLVLCSLVVSWHYFKAIKALYHALMLVFLAAMCGFCLTGDLFNLFVWFELMSASAVALCGYKAEELGPLQGAMNFAVTNTVGAFLSLSALGFLYAKTGALNLGQISAALAHAPADPFIAISFVFLAAGFLVKSALVPFHFWLADAHAVAPTPVCVLFSGVMVELGLYAVARIYWTIYARPMALHAAAVRDLFLLIGALTAVVGAFLCFLQRHLKRLLAFSTISHMGLMTIGFALLDPKALSGTVFYVLGHGVVKGALFICAGVLLHRFGSVDEYALQGKARKDVVLGILVLLAALGLAGLPPFANFLGDALIDETAKKLALPWISWLFIGVGALTAGAVLRVAGRAFLGLGKRPGKNEVQSGESSGDVATGKEERETGSHSPKAAAIMMGPVVLLITIGLAIPFFHGFTREILHQGRHMQSSELYVQQTFEGHADEPVEMSRDSELPKLKGPAIQGIATALLALFLAMLGMRGTWSAGYKHPERVRGPKRAFHALRAIHSGKISDYIAWFTLGISLYAAILLMLT
jgi:multicomponent Na+:H+ antiporter subunit D